MTLQQLQQVCWVRRRQPGRTIAHVRGIDAEGVLCSTGARLSALALQAWCSSSSASRSWTGQGPSAECVAHLAQEQTAQC